MPDETPDDGDFHSGDATACTPAARLSPEHGPVGDLYLKDRLRLLGPDTRIFDRFVLKREIGAGGMGVVWLAHDERLMLNVALKFLSDALVRDPSSISDLKDEIRNGRRVVHSGVVHLYDLYQDDAAGYAAIGMEYVDGPNLATRRREQPQRCFDHTTILPWIDSLCETLDYIHGLKTIHRDLKPGNLMLTSQGRLKLADFGISVSVSETAPENPKYVYHGTLHYMSPQQAGGERPSPADDIYALGATVYELLTSRPPFYGSPDVIREQRRAAIPISMGERRAELEIADQPPIPARWEKYVALCLAKDPASRPSAYEMRKALGARTFKRRPTTPREPASHTTLPPLPPGESEGRAVESLRPPTVVWGAPSRPALNPLFHSAGPATPGEPAEARAQSLVPHSASAPAPAPEPRPSPPATARALSPLFGGAPRGPEPASAPLDYLDCSIHAPRQFSPGKTHAVEVYLDAREAIAHARAWARESGEPEPPVAAEPRLRFEIDLPGCTAEPAVQDQVWLGAMRPVAFKIQVASPPEAGPRVGKILVSHASAPIGTIELAFEITLGPTWSPIEGQPAQLKRHQPA